MLTPVLVSTDLWMQPFTIAGRPVSRLEDMPSATLNVTDSHYVHTLAIPLLKGRDFSDTDTETSQPVALINRTFANTYFPSEDPVGKQIQLGLPQPMVSATAPNLRLTVIGVIGDTMNRGLALPPLPQLTALFRQTPDLNYGFKNLIVRTVLDPGATGAFYPPTTAPAGCQFATRGSFEHGAFGGRLSHFRRALTPESSATRKLDGVRSWRNIAISNNVGCVKNVFGHTAASTPSGSRHCYGIITLKILLCRSKREIAWFSTVERCSDLGKQRTIVGTIFWTGWKVAGRGVLIRS